MLCFFSSVFGPGSEGLYFILWLSVGYCRTIREDIIRNRAIFLSVLLNFWYWFDACII